MENDRPTILAALLQAAIDEGKQPSLMVESDSMKPLLKVGDRVFLEAITPERLQRGDIITVFNGDHLLSHRFWSMVEKEDETWLLLRGDRNFRYDHPVRFRDVVGRVHLRDRGGKYLSLTTGPGGWLNRHLTALLRVERGFRHRLVRTTGDLDLIAHRNLFTRGLSFLSRWLIYSWSLCLGAVLHQFFGSTELD